MTIKKLSNNVDALGEFLLKSEKNMLPEDYKRLEQIFFALQKNKGAVEDELQVLNEKNEGLEEELEEKKEILWNNPVFRQSIVRQAMDVAIH